MYPIFRQIFRQTMTLNHKISLVGILFRTHWACLAVGSAWAVCPAFHTKAFGARLRSQGYRGWSNIFWGTLGTWGTNHAGFIQKMTNADTIWRCQKTWRPTQLQHLHIHYLDLYIYIGDDKLYVSSHIPLSVFSFHIAMIVSSWAQPLLETSQGCHDL